MIDQEEKVYKDIEIVFAKKQDGMSYGGRGGGGGAYRGQGGASEFGGGGGSGGALPIVQYSLLLYTIPAHTPNFLQPHKE